MASPRNLPKELFDQVFAELIALCERGSGDVEEDGNLGDRTSRLWSQRSSHPLKAFGNACCAFRHRVQCLMWETVALSDPLSVEDSWRLDECVRCVNAHVLRSTQQFTYSCWSEEFYLGQSELVREMLCCAEYKNVAEAQSGLQLSENGTIDVPLDAPLVELADVDEELGPGRGRHRVERMCSLSIHLLEDGKRRKLLLEEWHGHQPQLSWRQAG